VVGLALADNAVNRLTIIGAIRRHRGDGAGDLVEQRADLGRVAGLGARQLGRQDLAAATLWRPWGILWRRASLASWGIDHPENKGAALCPQAIG